MAFSAVMTVVYVFILLLTCLHACLFDSSVVSAHNETNETTIDKDLHFTEWNETTIDQHLMSTIITDIQTMCGSSIRKDNSTTWHHESSRHTSQCRGGCSCDECCDHNEIRCCVVDNEERMKEECTLPSTSSPTTDKHRYVRYTMVSFCPSPGEYNMSDYNCKDVDVSPWGSLFPVHSHETDTTYKNEHCAICNGEYNYTHWSPSLTCPIYDTHKVDIDTITAVYQSSEVFNMCQVDFIPPESVGMSTKICYKYYIDQCTANDFAVPENWKSSKEEVVRSCESNFVSLYPVLYTQELYKNMFCIVCNGLTPYIVNKEDISYINASCDGLEQWGSTRTMTGDTLTVGIDPGLLHYMPYGTHSKLTCNQTVENCRPRHCPSGQVSVSDGQCVFPVSWWPFNRYQVNLKLVPTTRIADDTNFTYEFFSEIIPWPKDWYIRRIGVRWSLDGTVVDHFLVSLYMETQNTTTSPGNLLQNVASYMTRPWYYIINDTESKMVAEWSPFKIVDIIKTTHSEHYFYIPDYTRIQDEHSSCPYIVWKRLGEYVTIETEVRLILSKMLFCEQIELKDDEYILLHDNTVLYHKPTKQYLFDGQFSVVSLDKETMLRIRICAEDSVLSLEPDSDLACRLMYGVVTLIIPATVMILQLVY